MTALADACHDLANALPRAEALITTPDTDGSSGHGQPSSRPPWNQAAATALLDALEGARQLEQAWRSHAAGRAVPVRPMRMTGAVLASLLRLAHSVPEDDVRDAVILLVRWTTPIYQLAAVDLEEHAIRLPAAVCPYCENPVLLARIRERKVACPRGVRDKNGELVCADSDGNAPKGYMGYSRLDGTPQIEWNDGLVT